MLIGPLKWKVWQVALAAIGGLLLLIGAVVALIFLYRYFKKKSAAQKETESGPITLLPGQSDDGVNKKKWWMRCCPCLDKTTKKPPEQINAEGTPPPIAPGVNEKKWWMRCCPCLDKTTNKPPEQINAEGTQPPIVPDPGLTDVPLNVDDPSVNPVRPQSINLPLPKGTNSRLPPILEASQESFIGNIQPEQDQTQVSEPIRKPQLHHGKGRSLHPVRIEGVHFIEIPPEKYRPLPEVKVAAA